MFCNNTNEELIDEIFFWRKDIIQDTYDQDQKSFVLEFLDLEEYLVLLTE